MEPLFQSNSKLTYDEYKKFSWAVHNKMNRLPLTTFGISALLCVMAFLTKEIFFAAAAVATPACFCIVYICTIKRTYRANRTMQDMDVTFYFYSDHMDQVSSIGNTTIEYSKLYRVLETKTNFYLMIGKNQGSVVVKANCSPELISFLQTLNVKKHP